jgi:hypothetical protein
MVKRATALQEYLWSAQACLRLVSRQLAAAATKWPRVPALGCLRFGLSSRAVAPFQNTLPLVGFWSVEIGTMQGEASYRTPKASLWSAQACLRLVSRQLAHRPSGEGRRTLAGGETTGEGRYQPMRPGGGAGQGSTRSTGRIQGSSRALPGRVDHGHPLPVISSPANILCPSGTKFHGSLRPHFGPG